MANDKMLEAIVHSSERVEIKQVDIPKPGPNQVLIKVAVAGTNPKDWKIPEIPQFGAHNSGDDVAGTIAALGEGVEDFKVGDRVAAFHEMTKPHGAFAEYTIAWAHTTFPIPKDISYEEAATLPLAAMTAAIGMYLVLGLPEPWKPAIEKTPVIIYGGSGAVGAYAVKYAQKSNLHPLLVVAGKGKEFVESIIDKSKGDTYIDYREGDEAVVKNIEKALKDNGCDTVYHAMDAVSEHGSFQNISKILGRNEKGSKMCNVLPGTDYSDVPKNIYQSLSMVGRVHGKNAQLGMNTDDQDFGYVFFRYMTSGLKEGWFRGHPYEVVPGGLDGVQEGLKRLKAGEASAKKFVYRISETKSKL